MRWLQWLKKIPAHSIQEYMKTRERQNLNNFEGQLRKRHQK